MEKISVHGVDSIEFEDSLKARTFITEHCQDKSLRLEYVQHIPHHAPIVPQTCIGLEGRVRALLLRGDVDGEVAVVKNSVHGVAAGCEGCLVDGGSRAKVVDARLCSHFLSSCVHSCRGHFEEYRGHFWCHVEHHQVDRALWGWRRQW